MVAPVQDPVEDRERDLVAAPAGHEIVVDGSLADWAGDASSLEVDATAESDLSASVWATHALDALYLGVRVRDGDLCVPAAVGSDDALPGEGDRLELWIAPATEPDENLEHVHLVFWPLDRVRPAEIRDLRGSSRPRLPAGLEQVSQPLRDESGYELEIRLPWAGIGIDPRQQRELAFQLSFVDVDAVHVESAGDAPRSETTRWLFRGESSGTEQLSYGALRLSGISPEFTGSRHEPWLPRVLLALVVVASGIGALVLVGSWTRRRLRHSRRRALRWAPRAWIALAAIAVGIVVVPETVHRLRERAARQDLERRGSELADAFRLAQRDPELQARLRTLEPASIAGLLQGRGIPLRGVYRYRTVDVLGDRRTASDYRSQAFPDLPFREYGLPVGVTSSDVRAPAADAQVVLTLPAPESVDEVHLAVASLLPDGETSIEDALVVELLYADGSSATQERFALWDTRFDPARTEGSGPRVAQQRGGFLPRFEGRGLRRDLDAVPLGVVEHLICAIPDLQQSSEGAQVASVTVRKTEAAESAMVWLSAVTLAHGVARRQYRPVDFWATDPDGFPMALSPGIPARREQQILPGDSYEVPLSEEMGSIDRLRVYYRAERSHLFSAAVDPEGEARAVVEVGLQGISEPVQVPLRTSIEVVREVPPTGKLPESYTCFLASSYPVQGGAEHYTGFEIPLGEVASGTDGLLMESLRLSVPEEAEAAFRLAAVTVAREIRPSRLSPDSLFVEVDGRLRLQQQVTEELMDPGTSVRFAVVDAGLVQELGPGFDRSLEERMRGTTLELPPEVPAGTVTEFERGGRRFWAAVVPFPAEDTELAVLLLHPHRGRSHLVRLWVYSALALAFAGTPALLLGLVRWLGRLTRIRSRLSILFLLTAVAPLVVVSVSLTNLLLNERLHGDLRRADDLLRGTEQRLGSLVQSARTLAENTHRQILALTPPESAAEHAAEIRELLSLRATEGAAAGERVELRATIESGAEEGRTDFYYSHAHGSRDRRWLAPDDGLSFFEGDILYAASFSRTGVTVRVCGKVQVEALEGLGLQPLEGESLGLLSPVLRWDEPGEGSLRRLEGGTALAQARIGSALPVAECAFAADRLDRGEDRVVHQDSSRGTRVYDLLRTSSGEPIAVVAVSVEARTPRIALGPLQLDVLWFATLVAGIGLACALFLGSAVTDGILRPLLRMQRGARVLEGEGARSSVAEDSNDEIGELAQSFQRMARELERRAKQQEMLAVTSAELTVRLDLSERAEVAVRMTQKVLAGRSAACYCFDSTGETLVLEGTHSAEGVERPHAPARIHDASGPLSVARLQLGPRWYGEETESVDGSSREQAALSGSPRAGAAPGGVAVLPFGRAGRTTGVILVHGESTSDGLAALDPHFLESLLSQIAVALENARLFRMAVEDPQTGLHVHSYFASRVAEEVDRAADRGGSLTLARIVASTPSQDGELRTRLAVAVARELRRVCHDRELLARRSELEFDVMMPDVADRGRVDALLDALEPARERILDLFPALGSLQWQTAVATFPEDGRSRDFLFQCLAERRATPVGRSSADDRRRVRALVEELSPEARFSSPRSLAVVEELERASRSDATILILGETGTGKEVLAELAHRMSRRSSGPFVAVHCAALPERLLESELFGHERGAFTGADRRRVGRFEAAQGGTLFLDEIAEIAPEVQVKLLRVLQERKVQRLGSSQDVPVDVRLIAATHRSLEEMVARGTFREDLYYRLQVVRVEMPPLRERLEELPELVELFLAQASQESGRTVTRIEPSALDRLRRHSWPGNVRELRNVVLRAVALGRSEALTRDDLQLGGVTAPAGPVRERPADGGALLLNGRQEHLLRMLEKQDSVTSREYTEWTGVSQRTALRDLRQLMKAGLITKEGTRKAAVYRLIRSADLA